MVSHLLLLSKESEVLLVVLYTIQVQQLAHRSDMCTVHSRKDHAAAAVVPAEMCMEVQLLLQCKAPSRPTSLGPFFGALRGLALPASFPTMAELLLCCWKMCS